MADRRTSGVNELIAELYAVHGRALTRFLHRLTAGQQTAEDLLQETMLRAWRHVDSLPLGRDDERRWLYTVARRLAIDHIRRRKARPVETPSVTLEYVAGTDDPARRVVAAQQVIEAFCRLSDEHRAVLWHIHLEGRSIRETAELLGLPPGTVKSRTFYAMSVMRAAVDLTVD